MRSCISSTLHRVRRASPISLPTSSPWLPHSSAVEVEEWGSRKLAYPINYKTEGYYVLMSFTSEPSFPRELDRKLRIADGVMRSLIVCKGE